MKKAYFAGGCFWCITPIFNEMDSVLQVVSGYLGGKEENPSYKDVKEQKTGHRETICIEYDENKITFSKLLEIFIQSVDPFDEDGQFIDRGHSYTLAIYYTDEKECEIATNCIHDLEISSGQKVFISVEPFIGFYEAEEYHQDYYLKNPEEFQLELIESGRLKKES